MNFKAPRVRGVLEHLERAQFFFDLSIQQSDEKKKFRLMLAAIYSCRGMVEIVLEAADKEELVELNRKSVEAKALLMLPYYSLIERIRIHDFHRFGIVPPDPEVVQAMLGGPIKLHVKKRWCKRSNFKLGSHGTFNWKVGCRIAKATTYQRWGIF